MKPTVPCRASLLWACLCLLLCGGGTLFAQPRFVDLPATLTLAEDTPLLDVPFGVTGHTNPVTVNLGWPVMNDRIGVLQHATVRHVGEDNGVSRWVLSVYPAPNRSGIQHFNLLATAAGQQSASAWVHAQVTPVPDAPLIAPIAPVTAYAGQRQVSVPFQIRAMETSPVSYSVTNETPWVPLLLQVTPQLSPEGSANVLVQFLDPDWSGFAIIAVTARQGQLSARESFLLTVQPPAFRAGGPVLALNAAGAVQLDLLDRDTNAAPDVAVVRSAPPRTEFYAQQTNGQWSSYRIEPLTPGVAGVRGDFNSDGITDHALMQNRLVGWLTRSELVILLQGPTGTHGAVLSTNTLPWLRTYGMAAADLDNDGDLDLLFSAGNNAEGYLWQGRNDGQGAFEILPLNVGGAQGAIAAADVDLDGDQDFVISSTAARTTVTTTPLLFLNDGRGRFAVSPARLPPLVVTQLGWSDFTGDGRPDLWLVANTNTRALGQAPSYHTLLLEQTATGFREARRLGERTNHPVMAPVFADFDHDGRVDFVAHQEPLAGSAETTSYFALYRGLGDGRFGPGEFLTGHGGAGPLFGVAGDRNGDRAPDLILLGGSSNYLTNTVTRPNPPPGVPRNLRAEVQGRRLLLRWDAVTDANQPSGLRYRVRAGSAPGRGDVLSAGLTPGDASVTAPLAGDAGARTFQVLDLALSDVQRLHWSVQAVDASLVTGPFAPEQVIGLEISGRREPPRISPLADVTLALNGSTSVAFSVADDLTPPALLELRVAPEQPGFLHAGALSLVRQAPQQSGRWRLFIQPGFNAQGTVLVRVMATDRAGLTATNAFRLTVSADAPPAAALRLSRDESGNAGLQMTGPPGSAGMILHSTNLVTWEPVIRYQFDQNGTMSLPGLNPPDQPAGFFRVVPD